MQQIKTLREIIEHRINTLELTFKIIQKKAFKGVGEMSTSKIELLKSVLEEYDDQFIVLKKIEGNTENNDNEISPR